MKKTKFILIALGIGALLAVILTFFQVNKRKAPFIPPAPTPTPAPAEFKLVSVNPQGETEVVLSNIAITLLFSQDIDPSSVKVTTDPKTNLKIEVKDTDNRVLYLKPKDNWKFGQEYQFSVSATSLDGGIIDNYSFSFKPKLLTVGEAID